MQTKRDPPTPEGDEKKPRGDYYQSNGPPRTQRAALILGARHNHVYVKSLDPYGVVVWK